MATLQELQQKISAGGVPSADLLDQYRAALSASTGGPAPVQQTNPLLSGNNLGSIGVSDSQWQAYNSPGGGGYSPAPAAQQNPLIAPAAAPQSSATDYSKLGALQQAFAAERPGSTLDFNVPMYQSPMGQVGRMPEITKLYRDFLGRDPDAEGLKYWAANNQSMDEVRNAIANSPEAMSRNGTARPDNSWSQAVPIGGNNPAITDPNQGWTAPAMNASQTGVRPANPLLPPSTSAPPTTSAPRTPDAAPLTTRPPTRFAAEYPYPSPTNRQLAAANDQRATPMTQPVGFASNNPLLNRFGTARLGEYTGARETPGNVPPPWTPTTNPLPGIINGQQGSAAVSATEAMSGPSKAATSALLTAAPALAGMAIPAAIDLISKLPGGAAVADKVASLIDTPAMAGGNLTFTELLKHPTIGQAVGAALAGLPDILSGDYAKAAGASLGSYGGTAAGIAAGAGVGGITGNFIIPGLGGIVGAYIGRKVGSLFGPGASVGPNAGQSMEFDRTTGQLKPGDSGQDNSGQNQEGFVNKFMDGIATVVNEANAKTGGKYIANVSKGLPLYVEVLGGKINVYDDSGNVKSFAGSQTEDAFKYAVDVATRYPGLKLPG